jgi:hypothetical protein
MTNGTEYSKAVFITMAIALSAVLLVMAASPLKAETTQNQVTVANGEPTITANDCIKPMTVELCKKCCKGWGDDCLVKCGIGMATNWTNTATN